MYNGYDLNDGNQRISLTPDLLYLHIIAQMMKKINEE